jgi:steroid delta-isomerase-like uncharacterized protein
MVELSAMKTEENKATVLRWFEEVWNQGREATIDEMHLADGVSYGLGGANTEVRGPEQFKVFFRNLRGAFPDTHITFLDAIAEGDKVLVRFEVQATHSGEGLPFPPTGRPVKFSGMTLMELVDGKLAKAWNSWDQLGMMMQLGVLPASFTADNMLKEQSPVVRAQEMEAAC